MKIQSFAPLALVLLLSAESEAQVNAGVASYIEQSHLNAYQKVQARTFAKWMQSAVEVDVSDKTSIEVLNAELNVAAGCLSRAFDNPYEGFVVLREIKSRTLISEQSKRIYAEYNASQSGSSFRLASEISCPTHNPK